MGAECKDLQKFGFKAFERKDCRQTFLTQVVELKVMSIADDYWFRLLARIKSIAVSVGALPSVAMGGRLVRGRGEARILACGHEAPHGTAGGQQKREGGSHRPHAEKTCS